MSLVGIEATRAKGQPLLVLVLHDIFMLLVHLVDDLNLFVGDLGVHLLELLACAGLEGATTATLSMTPALSVAPCLLFVAAAVLKECLLPTSLLLPNGLLIHRRLPWHLHRIGKDATKNGRELHTARVRLGRQLPSDVTEGIRGLRRKRGRRAILAFELGIRAAVGTRPSLSVRRAILFRK